jgi:hypothetical protein
MKKILGKKMKVSEGIFDTEKSNKCSEPSHAAIMPPNTRLPEDGHQSPGSPFNIILLSHAQDNTFIDIIIIFSRVFP